MATDIVSPWDLVLRYEKTSVVSHPRVTPGCTVGSVGIGALLNMAATTPRPEGPHVAPAGATFLVVDSSPTIVFAPTEEPSHHGDSYI